MKRRILQMLAAQFSIDRKILQSFADQLIE